MVKPWLDAGFPCIIIDIQHKPGLHKDHRNPLLPRGGFDILHWTPPLKKYRMVFGFPPCTHLCVSGARWWKQKGLELLIEGLSLFQRCLEIAEWTRAPYALENPVGRLSTIYRKPDYIFDPCDFGEPYTKRTCLWTGNNFKHPIKHRVDPYLGSKMHTDIKDSNERSVTPKGFAKAVFASNEPNLNLIRMIEQSL